MSTNFRSMLSGKAEWLGITDAGTPGVLATANASANTKGNWASIGTPTFDYQSILYIPREGTTTNPIRIMADLGIGATPDVVCDNLLIEQDRNNEGTPIWLPLYCPEGQAIQHRVQATTGSTTVSGTIIGFSSAMIGFPTVNKIVAIGADTANTAGTQLDPGGSANTLGAYVSLSAGGHTRDFAGFMLSASKRNVVATDTQYILNIALGATPDIILRAPLYCDNANDTMDPKTIGPCPLFIPRSTAIKAAVMSNNATATDRLVEVMLHGFEL